MSLPARLIGGCVVALLLGACQKAQEPTAVAPPPAVAEPAAEPAAASPDAVSQASAATEWPASLHVFGEGFPKAGDPCRNVGESEATANFLDHTAWLVGCRSEADAAALGGRVVATVDGVTLVSIPR